MTSEPTNHDRAEWAKEALAVFTASTFGGDHPDTMDRSDLHCAIHDLITDLLHFAERQDFDTGQTLYLAVSNFDAEKREEVQP